MNRQTNRPTNQIMMELKYVKTNGLIAYGPIPFSSSSSSSSSYSASYSSYVIYSTKLNTPFCIILMIYRFSIFWCTDRQTERPTGKPSTRSSLPKLKNTNETKWNNTEKQFRQNAKRKNTSITKYKVKQAWEAISSGYSCNLLVCYILAF